MPRRLVLVLAALAACSGKGTSPARDDATPPQPPVTWRGPSLYTLVEGEVTVGIALRLPGGWAEDAGEARQLVTSPAGSTMSVTLSPAAAAAAPTRTASGSHHEHAVTTAAGTWVVACDVAVVPADRGVFDDLARQCAELVVQHAPDDRVTWKLEVEPADVPLADLSSVTIRYHVTNQSEAPVDAKAYALEWRVDAAASQQLGNAFGNGGYERKWHALPPGESLHDSRKGMKLVDVAGDHVISLHHLGREVARATLHVR